MHKDQPLFPIKVTFFEDNDEWVLDNENELASNLEWFDSKDQNENTRVVDSLNRPVRVKVEKLKLVEFFLEEKIK